MLFKKGDTVKVCHHTFPWIGIILKTTKSKATYYTYNGKYRLRIKRLSFAGPTPEHSWHYMNEPERIFWDKEIKLITPAPIKGTPKFKAKNGKKLEINIIKW